MIPLFQPSAMRALILSLRFDLQDTGPVGIVANVSRGFVSSLLIKVGLWVQPKELCQNCYRRKRRLTAYLVQPDGTRQRTIDPCLHCASTLNWQTHWPLCRVEYEPYVKQPGSRVLFRQDL